MRPYWTASNALAAKIDSADKGPRGNMQRLLGQIQDYIEGETGKIKTQVHRTEAATGKKLPPDKIPVVACPTPSEWTALSSGRRPVLPSEALMRLYASDSMRSLASDSRVDGLRDAYFKTAKFCLEQGKRFSSR